MMVLAAASESLAPQRLRCLAVRPVATANTQGGDEVVYRKQFEYLSRSMDIEVFELHPIGRVRQLIKLAQGVPPESTRYLGQDNFRRLAAVLSTSDVDVVCFFNEVSFPYLNLAKGAGLPALLVAQNTASRVAATDPSWWARMYRPMAVAFERRWYGDGAAGLVCISRGDIEALAKAGVRRSDIWLSPPGAPPAVELRPGASVQGELVLTGSYNWWRKRRDLKSFAEGMRPPFDILVSDPLALRILGDRTRLITDADPDWSSALRVGIVTDRFSGGFKLKSLEYVAKNCAVLSFNDIASDFEGLPHVDEFVVLVSSSEDVARVVTKLQQQGIEAVKRFRIFKRACMERYRWDACLEPLKQAVENVANR